ncbi:chromosome segregation protein SMC [Bifidobacterium eulemuris]|uniref:Chromosome partition protein Smc n=1 Tax=Bifidobacterium eulemuris TaxID=1765219 RepID=A0A261G7K7_9BIFI|nr:chromosome segregation protein SMC [Bifidobacterium eulemuris]OZG67410.1 chromosome segregation protein SMC [Bifidobacterium eulemuris]QOL32979.1 chromosome segregation protein SMC [Bifidobacterium eulemuris]
MYLKELTLRGFKSFASSTTLRFEPGITAVVGPNGSGKSNIVDALTWVMGEQGAKNLRGTSMEDVIFAGTSSRPPLGRAQVSLTIDNSDHTLDIDYTEVTISRTIFRNGGSEYAINGSQCRLLDIQELLSDTGLGQQMHVIVGQGRLDAILRADPSGHRAFIEEAAGILKHRKRKERALRKLANTETNLSRLDDLLGEIHRQLGPLGRQARISRRAESIQVSLRDAQSRLYAEDAQRSLARRESVRGELAEVRGKLAEAQRDLAEVKVRIEQVEALSSQSNPAIDEVNRQWRELSRLEERFTSLSDVARERVRSLQGQMVTNLGEDPELLEHRAKELEEQAAAHAAMVDDARLALDKTTEERADGEKKLASVRQTLTELRKTAQERDTQIARLREMIAREESAVQLAETRAKDFSAQRDSLSTQHDEAVSQRQALERESEESADDDGKALDEARAALAQSRDALNELLDRQRDVNAKAISSQAKADALRDTLESRNASGALERDEKVGALGRLTDVIVVSEGWEEAVAHALDQFASAIIVPGEEHMLHALRRAHEDRLGKAVLLHPVDGDDTDAADGASSALCAARLVSENTHGAASGKNTAIVSAVRRLLADIAAVETLDDAITVVRDSVANGGPWRQAVTKDGELVNAVGAIGGSSLSQSDLSLAARRDKALRQVEELTRQGETLAEQVAEATARRDAAGRVVDAETAKRTEARLKAEQAAKSLKAADDRVANIERQIAAVDAKINDNAESREAHQLKLDDLNRALHAAQSSADEHADSDELSERERQLETALNTAREHEVAAKIAWTETSRKAESLARQAGLLRDNAKEAVERRARIEALNERRAAQSERMAAIADQAAEAARLVAQAVAGVVAKREELQAAASSHDEELKTLRARRNEIEPKVTDLTGREHVLDVNRERLAAEHGQLTQKVSDELGMTLEELIAGYGPDQPVPVLDDNGNPVPLEEGDYQTVPYNRAEQQKRLEKAKRDLAALGKINPLATEEYDALQERNKYLNDQRADVANSRDDLMRLIKELDATMVDVFASAFEDTAKAFEQMFSTLFPGGQGRLRLENPDDMLTTGVLVEASPAGKRVKQLSLLSGGERSLTALALLFAIFTARPSPFYVMDEVEAALDDVNLTRLINAFNELREHAQLIIITHQQRTMSIADALYGVTMRADGVTAVVSQKLEREA